jgi:hypothetical protein
MYRAGKFYGMQDTARYLLPRLLRFRLRPSGAPIVKVASQRSSRSFTRQEHLSAFVTVTVDLDREGAGLIGKAWRDTLPRTSNTLPTPHQPPPQHSCPSCHHHSIQRLSRHTVTLSSLHTLIPLFARSLRKYHRPRFRHFPLEPAIGPNLLSW